MRQNCVLGKLAIVTLLVSVALTSFAQRAGPDEIYPDATRTPGEADPDIKQSKIQDTICNKNWTGVNKFTHKTKKGTDIVRPPARITDPIKTQTMHDYGFADSKTHYELDHLISLQNGGCGDCVTNLWPEAYGDTHHHMTTGQRAQWDKDHPNSSAILPGSLQKDRVEGYVHDGICLNVPDANFRNKKANRPPSVITLKRGQEILATDWYMCYTKMTHHMACE
jgi:hypothetical protein